MVRFDNLTTDKFLICKASRQDKNTGLFCETFKKTFSDRLAWFQTVWRKIENYCHSLKCYFRLFHVISCYSTKFEPVKSCFFIKTSSYSILLTYKQVQPVLNDLLLWNCSFFAIKTTFCIIIMFGWPSFKLLFFMQNCNNQLFTWKLMITKHVGDVWGLK